MYQDLFSLREKVFIVTGGTGHLGSEISKGLAEHGARVYALGRRAEPVETLNAYNSELEAQEGAGRIIAKSVDVFDDKQFNDFLQAMIKEEGRIDGLVNNAVSAKREHLEEMNKDLFLDGINGAVTHYFENSVAVAKAMKELGSEGVIINNCSLFGFLAHKPAMHLDLKNWPAVHHVVAKGGVIQMTKYMAVEYAPDNIRVNCFSPGWFPRKRGPERPDYMHQLSSHTPMNRIGKSHEIPGVVIFLASRASSYMTGQNVIVDGGYSIW